MHKVEVDQPGVVQMRELGIGEFGVIVEQGIYHGLRVVGAYGPRWVSVDRPVETWSGESHILVRRLKAKEVLRPASEDVQGRVVKKMRDMRPYEIGRIMASSCHAGMHVMREFDSSWVALEGGATWGPIAPDWDVEILPAGTKVTITVGERS